MEEGLDLDQGRLSPVDELTLIGLDQVYRETQGGEIFPSRNKEMFYLMSHRPPGSTDIEDPDYNPNHYVFFIAGMVDHEQREKDKVFILFLSEETGNHVRVVNTAELRAHHKEELDLSDDEIFSRPELMEDFWQAVESQGSLGATVPNNEDMEDFGDIVNAWDEFYKTKSKNW